MFSSHIVGVMDYQWPNALQRTAPARHRRWCVKFKVPLLIALTLVTSACATTGLSALSISPDVRRASKADDRLFQDMLAGVGGVGFADHVFYPNARQSSVIRIDVISPYGSGQKASERWHIQHDGADTVTYLITFTPDGKGGTYFSIKREQSNVHGKNAASFRMVPIPKEEHGYSNFESTVVTSQGELDKFLQKDSKGQGMGWNNGADFEKALAQAKLDFDREALVLLRHTEGSGAVQVNFRQPSVKERRLICQIDRKEPEVGTGDMAYYCFALAVAKADVEAVEMQSSSKKSITLSIAKGKESNQVPEDTARKLADPQH